MRQLQQENLVMADINGGLCVATLSITDALHLYDCRIALEQLSVVEACRNITTAQLEKLDLAVLQAEKMTGHQPHHLTNFQLLHMDHQFHRLLTESSGNPWLGSLLEQVFDKMALLRLRTMQHNPGVLEIRSEHRRIYQAVADRNPEAATKAIQEHLFASKERVIREIQELEQNSKSDFS